MHRQGTLSRQLFLGANVMRRLLHLLVLLGAASVTALPGRAAAVQAVSSGCCATPYQAACDMGVPDARCAQLCTLQDSAWDEAPGPVSGGVAEAGALFRPRPSPSAAQAAYRHLPTSVPPLFLQLHRLLL